jgi:rare lipoprotein A
VPDSSHPQPPAPGRPGTFADGTVAGIVAERGMASWYGGTFNGQLAASGEIYNQEQLTAAHRTLPFGTMVRVRRMDSPASIVVRINDRGPYVGARIIDLSYAAARRLGMTDPGLVPVALEILQMARRAATPAGDTGSVFAVQAGTFRNPDNARRTRARMEETYGEARIVTAHGDGAYWCVLVGRSATRAEAEALAAAVRKSDQSFQSAFVVRLDAASLPAD